MNDMAPGDGYCLDANNDARGCPYENYVCCNTAEMLGTCCPANDDSCKYNEEHRCIA